MKYSLILSLIIALGIACSAPKAEAVNWKKTAKASFYGAIIVASAIATNRGIQAYNSLKSVEALLFDSKGVIQKYPLKAMLRNARYASMAFPCGILTLLCAKKFYDTVTKKDESK